MRTVQFSFEVRTPGRSLIDITERVAALAESAPIQTGLANVFLRHTSASLIIGENADPDVGRDLLAYFERLVPDGDPLYRHTAEGPDDMPAHVRAVLTATSLSIPLTGGALALGTWQGLFLFEHRRAPHRRTVVVTIQGE